MRKTIIWTISVIGVGAVLALGYNCFINNHNSDLNTISVSGECLTSAPKDRTAITLRVKTLENNAAESMKIATDKIAEITTFLKTQDVEMQTTQFDSYEKTEWDSATQKSVPQGIETTIAIEVSAKKTEIIEKVLEQFAGHAYVYSDNLHMFTSAETLKPILEKCLGDAVANARTRASAIAAGDNRKIGKLISAEYSSGNMGDIRPSNFLRNSAKMEAVAFDMGGALATKDTNVSVSVSATFKVK